VRDTSTTTAELHVPVRGQNPLLGRNLSCCIEHVVHGSLGHEPWVKFAIWHRYQTAQVEQSKVSLDQSINMATDLSALRSSWSKEFDVVVPEIRGFLGVL
jgi:hypothetical protein